MTMNDTDSFISSPFRSRTLGFGESNPIQNYGLVPYRSVLYFQCLGELSAFLVGEIQ